MPSSSYSPLAACGPSVKTVTVEPAKATLDAKGATAQLAAVARDDKGQPIDAAKVKVAWSSSVPQAAAVDEGGTVTAQRSGEAVVTAAVGEMKGTAQVVVSIPISVSVSLPSRDLRPGETVVLSVVVVDDTGKPVTVSAHHHLGLQRSRPSPPWSTARSWRSGRAPPPSPPPRARSRARRPSP